MDQEQDIQTYCDECNHPVKEMHRYCANCGEYLAGQATTINVFNNLSLRQVFVFYFVYLFVCLMVKYSSWFSDYDQLFWVELALAVITLRFVWLNRKSIFPIMRFNNFRWYVLVGVVAIAAVGSAVVNVSIREVNITLFNSDVSYYSAYKLYFFPTALMIYSIAIMPAIFEELAFRGVMFNYCATFLDERLVVAVTAFLFAIMHLSLLSLVWLIPFGFFIGHLRRRYNTLWYGIIFHFVFNFTACLIDLYRGGELF
jgi:membrane protease YdiL (CAAX protease family)